MANLQWLERMELLTGKEVIHRLQKAKVLVVGLGGVGSYAAEFLARAGIGSLTIVDGDLVEISNKNRQLPALDSTIGLSKAAVVGQRIKDINTDINLEVIEQFLEPEVMEKLVAQDFDFIPDCIDSFKPKLLLILSCKKAKKPFISSMGAGGKFKPELIRVINIFKTRNCPLAQQIRKALRKRRINSGFKVVASDEEVVKESMTLTNGSPYKKSSYGTISYMPAMFGIHMAAHVIQKIGDI